MKENDKTTKNIIKKPAETIAIYDNDTLRNTLFLQKTFGKIALMKITEMCESLEESWKKLSFLQLHFVSIEERVLLLTIERNYIVHMKDLCTESIYNEDRTIRMKMGYEVMIVAVEVIPFSTFLSKPVDKFLK